MKMHFSSKIYIWMSMTKKQKIKATQVSINSWVNKILYIHTVENYPSLYILTVENYPSLRHHWLDGHESEWTLAVGDGQGGLACCDSWGCKSRTRLSNWTELNWTELKAVLFAVFLGIFTLLSIVAVLVCILLLFIYLIFSCVESFFLCGLFSSYGYWGLLSRCGVQAAHCCGFSCCGAQALGMQASVVSTPRL